MSEGGKKPRHLAPESHYVYDFSPLVQYARARWTALIVVRNACGIVLYHGGDAIVEARRVMCRYRGIPTAAPPPPDRKSIVYISGYFLPLQYSMSLTGSHLGYNVCVERGRPTIIRHRRTVCVCVCARVINVHPGYRPTKIMQISLGARLCDRFPENVGTCVGTYTYYTQRVVAP